ncbi:uncharacterized protein LOC143827181 isoform X2 [Paroedura picta]|uniref:uncharacterized protein LOC143827181 isoform X2 n=1 Tax=Paroedura picta TaxID=143630 RepID=UPI0040567FB1
MPRAEPGAEEAMAARSPDGASVSARALARSVAHRLKYYIDVQRKENSYDSSGLIRDEMDISSCSTVSSRRIWCGLPNHTKAIHPACLTEWEHGRPLEHDFAEIKLEASLRTYMGSTKECYQKVQESTGKQKDLERFIKEMARDYVPEQMNEERAKKTPRQSDWLSTPPSLHRTATPNMTAEEVRRLISSASKLIVAATSEVSPKVLGATREAVSTPKRGAPETVPSSDCAWKQSCSSTQLHKDEGESMQECHEGFQRELNQKAAEKKDGKKPKSTKKRRHVKIRERPTEIASNVSCHSYKSNTILSKSNDLCSESLSFPNPYSPPGQNKVLRKGILTNRRSLSCTSSEISEYQNIEPGCHWKSSLHPSAGRSGKLVGMKRKKLSCTPTSGRRSSRSSKPLAGQPVLASRKTPEVIRNNMEACFAKQTAEGLHAPNGKLSEKTEKTYSSKEISGCAGLREPGKEMCDQGHWKSEFLGKSRGPWPEEPKGGCSSASEKDSECPRVHFQMFQPWYRPKTVEQKHDSDGCSLDNVRQPEGAALPITSVDESPEILAFREDRNKDTHEPSLGHPICQGEDQDAPARLPMNVDGTVGNQDNKGHLGKLLKQILTLDDDDPALRTQINDLISGEPLDEQVVYIPPVLLDVGETSEEGDGSSASSGMSVPVLGRLGNEDSDEEFTVSSASSRLSARSSASAESWNKNAGLKQGGENAGAGADIHGPNVMEESSPVQQRTFDRHGERQSSPAEGQRTNKDCGPEAMSAAPVVYFSHLPMSLG